MKYQVPCDDLGPKLVVDIALTPPVVSKALVFLTDGSGQETFSGPNNLLAAAFEQQGFGTCTMSLRIGEDSTNGFKPYALEKIGGLWRRVCTFLRQSDNLPSTKFCILAWGDGAAVALHAASAAPAEFAAMAIKGRTAEALNVAAKNTIPTLFLAGSEDSIATQATKAAFAAARGPKEFSVIDGVGPSLREPGSLEEVAARSAAWFERYS